MRPSHQLHNRNERTFIAGRLTAIVFTIFCSAVSLNIHAQNPALGDNPSLTKTIPPSPNAASLGKYGDVPVSYYSGIPSIGISLYDISAGDISLPVSLSYHAGGHKVEEIASWVGLGWTLSAGGVITRTVRGIPDDSPMELYGNYKSNIDYLLDDNIDDVAKKQRFLDIVDGGHGDTEPDVFTFNFGGYSGKFVIGEDGETIYPIPQQKISITINDGGGGVIEGWTITTADGMKYIFGLNANGSKDGIEYNTSYTVCETSPPSTPSMEISSWFLVEIISPRGHTVTFDYEPYTYDFRTFGNETSYYTDILLGGVECTDRFQKCYVRNHLNGRRLKRINFLNGKVEFDVRSTYRADLQDKALEFVRIYKTGEATPIKSYKFDYSYFLPIGGGNIPSESTTAPSEEAGADYRLKLVSVAELASDNTAKPPHRFFYNDAEALPPRIADYSDPDKRPYAQDHWGYYNGRINNQTIAGMPTLIPTFEADFGTGQHRQIKGADRSANEAYMDACILNKILYPTAGTTEFEFESNKIVSSFFPSAYLGPYDLRTAGASLNSASNSGEATGGLFTINSGVAVNGIFGSFINVKLIELATGQGACLLSDPAVTRSIHKASDNTEVISNSFLADGSDIFLPNGTYYVRLQKKSDYYCQSSFAIALNWQEYTTNAGGAITNVTVGGLRIKKITDYDGHNHNKDVVRYFRYNKFSDSTRSSGVLLNFPRYSWEPDIYVEHHPGIAELSACYFHVWQSYSNFPLAMTSGANLGYENVIVEFGLNGANGKTEYSFTTALDHPDIPGGYSTNFPFAPYCSFDWRRGKLIKEKSYKKAAGSFELVFEKQNFYNFHNTTGDPLQYTAYGLKVASTVRSINNGYSFSHFDYRVFHETKIQTEWVTLDSVQTKTFDPDDVTKWNLSTEIFEYKPTHQQLTKKKVVTSDDHLLVENYTYPGDYTGIPVNPTGNEKAILLLQNQKISNRVIEKYLIKQKKDGSDQKIIAGELTTFKENPLKTGTVIPEKSYSLFMTTPLPASGSGAFLPSGITSGAFTKDPLYKHVMLFNKHDVDGNIIELAKADDGPVSYIWSYQNTLPIAEVKNATIDRVFHTSFEEDGNINSVARTGRKVWQGAYPLLLPVSYGSYVISYYMKNATTGDPWQHISQTIAITSANAGNNMLIGSTGNVLDEVRMYPAGAAMTTYTYEPLTGMTSATDANNRSTYYFYDKFGRLSYLKDDKGNIVKEYKYNYKLSGQ